MPATPKASSKDSEPSLLESQQLSATAASPHTLHNDSSGGGSLAAAPDGHRHDLHLTQQAQLGALLLERGRYADALVTLQSLLAERPDAADLLCLQGRCLAAAGSRPQVSCYGQERPVPGSC